MSPANSAFPLEQFTSFGDLLKYLRRRAGLTQLELSIAVGCSGAHISRLEQNHRRPDLATLNARFIPALHLETEPQFAARLRDLAAPTPPLPATADTQVDPKQNLPLQLTSFIGREQESGQIQRLISVGRLVTLTGPGGVGKTRLALHAVGRMGAGFPDGTWLVELAPISNPSLVQTAVEAVLGISGGAANASLVEVLRPKNLLLILDNCEHLLEACAELAESLLRACPELRILATSREALGIAGELVSPVHSLGLPPSDQAPPVKTLAQVASVQLFVQRAAAVQPGFQLNAANASAIAQVCTRLDGLPLAIELAAARVPLLTVQQIAQRLDDRFRLLTRGSRNSIPRHQTLAALIDWSYDLLGVAEHRLLQRLSVFAGGWMLEAAEAVCADVATMSGEVLPLLGLLVGKSLIQAEPGAGGAMRYRLLETVRQYARERLLAAGQAEPIQNRHFEYFLELAQTAGPELRTPRKLKWLNQLEAELENLRSALEWGLARAEHGEATLRLAGGLLDFWSQRGHVSEGRTWLDRALASPAAPHAGAACAGALHASGHLARLQGDMMQAKAQLEASADLWRALGTAGNTGLAASLDTLSETIRRLGEPAEARSLAAQAIALYRQQAEPWGLAHSLSNLGMAIRDQEDFALARSILHESVDLWTAVGDQWGLKYAIESLGDVAMRQGDYQAALGHFANCLAMARELGDEEGVAKMLFGVGLATLNLGDRSQAKIYFEESFGKFREAGNRTGLALSYYYCGCLAYFEDEIQSAQKFFEQQLVLAHTTAPIWLRAQALMGLSSVAAACGQARQASLLLGASETQTLVAATYNDAADTLFERHVIDRIVAQIGEKAFASLLAEGRTMTFEQAAAFALETPNEGVDTSP